MKETSSWSFARDNKTGKGSKDPRARMVGVPKPMRDALVAAERNARKDAKSLGKLARRKASQGLCSW